jgi:stress response protein SCP2
LIENELKQRFSKLKSLGKIWINPKLENCPLPTQQRSSSKSIKTVARGTRLPFGDLNGGSETLRFFVYWIGQDIDLSATFHDENFKMVEQVSYTNLRSSSDSEILSVHSGDITQAPNGASEFLDIDIKKALETNVRYVVMSINSFTQQPYCNIPECFAGYMIRQKPNSGEIYDPRTVQNKFDLASDTKIVCPMIFDLHEMKMIKQRHF